MPRTRQLHPEFFKHEDLGDLSPYARLLFQGMWCEADREGRLEDRPRRLKGEWLPYDNVDGEELVSALAAGKHIVRYEVDGQKLIWIPSFKVWQRVHPNEEASELPAFTGESVRTTKVNRADNQGKPSGEPKTPLSSSSSLPSQSSFPSGSQPSGSDADGSWPGEFREAWNRVMPTKVPRLQKLTDERKKKILARAKESGGLSGLLAIVERASQSRYLRGEVKSWCVSVDWFLEPRNFAKVIEGNYENRDPAPARQNGSVAAEAYAKAEFEPDEVPAK